MNFMRFGVLAGVVLAAGCGGSNNDDKAPRDPYIEFRVNGVLEPKSLALDWSEVTNEDGGLCNPEVFDNGQDVLDSPDSGYCSRSLTTIQFSVRFTNPTYESIDVSFKGVGFEVAIYRYEGGAAQEEVWNSSYYWQKVVLANREDDPTVPDFDPNEVNSVEIAASDSFPSVKTGGSNAFTSVRFRGDQIFNPASYPSYDPSTAELALLEMKTPLNEDCDWFVRLNDSSTAYRRVECFGSELLPEPGTGTEPVQFLARVTFNFNGWTEQPDDIIITVNPPE